MALKYIKLSRENLINYGIYGVGLLAGGLYLASMVIYPAIDHHYDWVAIENVWDRWQSFNVGVLAFAASVIALHITTFSAREQRRRDILSAKAFLPGALSELTAYLFDSATALVRIWHAADGNKVDVSVPKPLTEYKEIFAQCMSQMAPEAGGYLAEVLAKLQVHNARLRECISEAQKGNIADTQTMLSYFFRLGELQALINNLFDFARNRSELDVRPLTWDDLKNAYANLDIEIDDIAEDDIWNLEAFSQRLLSRAENQSKSESKQPNTPR